MSAYLLLKTLHILSSVLLVGTGFGSAFYLYCANRSKSLQVQAVISRYVVLADWIFTTPAIILQPLTGLALASMAGWPLGTPWIAWSIVLYLIAGACWLPVVWIQIEMRRMAEHALADNERLPERYWRFARVWQRLGYPAFASMLAIYFLMVLKPTLA
ncbi:DUF2269 family protein [soil metagenome]